MICIFIYDIGSLQCAQTLQRLVNEVLGGLNFVLPYIYAICVPLSSATKHRKNLQIVFQRPRKYNLAINIKT